jgi:spore maturation protein CgeB
MKILLVAKPWRGGLANYVYRALLDLFPGEVEWWPTRPVHLADRIAFLRNRKEWYGRLLERLAGANADALLFINHLKIFDALSARPQQVLWMTDSPRPAPGGYACYGKVCLSDAGYAAEVAAVVGERFAGEVSFGYSPGIHLPPTDPRRARDLCFIGNRDPKRDRYLGALLAAGVRPTVVGNYFLRHPLFWRSPGCFRPAVANAAMGRIYARHRVSLNLHAQVVRRGTNMRTFECAAYGIPQLVENCPGLEAFFTPGEEIATFDGEENMLEALAWLLADPGRAAAMALRARRRALAEHSYHHRCITLLEGVLPPRLLQERLATLTRPGGPLEGIRCGR